MAHRIRCKLLKPSACAVGLSIIGSLAFTGLRHPGMPEHSFDERSLSRIYLCWALKREGLCRCVFPCALDKLDLGWASPCAIELVLIPGPSLRVAG